MTSSYSSSSRPSGTDHNRGGRLPPPLTSRVPSGLKRAVSSGESSPYMCATRRPSETRHSSTPEVVPYVATSVPSGLSSAAMPYSASTLIVCSGRPVRTSQTRTFPGRSVVNARRPEASKLTLVTAPA